jgi:hypothetical protein
MSFSAKFKGSCGHCGEVFLPETEVEYVDNVLVISGHEVEVPSGLDELGHKPENVCRRCFMVHNGECL